MSRFGFAVVAALFMVSVNAQMKGMDMAPAQGQSKAAVHEAKGVVTAIDTSSGKVMIKHEAVRSLNWPAMTMGFMVKDKAVLGRIKKDQKIDFEFVQQGKDYVVTAVK